MRITDEFVNNFGRFVLRERVNQDKTLLDLARETGVSVVIISRLEHLEQRNYHIATLLKIARALGMSEETFYELF